MANTSATEKGVSSCSWDDILCEYEVDLKSRNLSQKTIDWYRYVLNRFADFLAEKHIEKPIADIGTHEVKAYTVYLQSQAQRWPKSPHILKKGSLSPHSVQGHVRALKAFWSFLYSEGFVARNPLARYPLPKVPQNDIAILKLEDIQKLLMNIDRFTATGDRLYCILICLLDSGLRISELLDLKMNDIDLKCSYLRVLGKGQKFRVVPLSPPTLKCLLHYLHHSRSRICSEDSPYVFPAPDGGPISINSVQQSLRRLASSAGLVGIKCHPHVFRHTCASLSLAYGANALVLKEILGHASLATTQKYTHLQPEHLQVQHAKFSPVVNLNIYKHRRIAKG